MKAGARRVLVVADRFPPRSGGLARSALRNATNLHGHGVAVTICCPEPGLALGARRRHDEGELICWQIGVGDALSPRGDGAPRDRLDDALQAWTDGVMELARLESVHLLHAFYLIWSGYVATFAARALDLPVVVSARGNDVDREAFSPTTMPFLLWTLKHATAITGVSREILAKVRLLEPEARGHWVGNGVDSRVFHPDGEGSSLVRDLAASGRPVLAFLGEGKRKKGFDTLLEAFGRLREGRDLALLVIGALRPWGARRLERFREKFPEAARDLTIHETRDDAELAAILRDVDLLCLPSRHDGLPNAALEAMACGTPVAAAAVGGLPDCIRHGESGWLLPPEDGRRWARALGAILDEGPSIWKARGKAARRIVEELFTPEAEWRRNLAVYETML